MIHGHNPITWEVEMRGSEVQDHLPATVASSRLDWATSDPVSKEKKFKRLPNL